VEFLALLKIVDKESRNDITKQMRAQYTQEFKLEAVRQVKAGQAIAVVAKVLGIPKASLGNWVRQAAKGELLSGCGADDKVVRVSPEQMELARLRAENARLRMERDIAKKAAAYFAQDTLRGTPGFTK
jgi:transposase